MIIICNLDSCTAIDLFRGGYRCRRRQPPRLLYVLWDKLSVPWSFPNKNTETRPCSYQTSALAHSAHLGAIHGRDEVDGAPNEFVANMFLRFPPHLHDNRRQDVCKPDGQ